MADSAGRARSASRHLPGAGAFLFIISILAAGPCAAAEFTGSVVKVADGDTITVVDSGNIAHRVRLSGIDAPETSQPFGAQARSHLYALLHGKEVVVVWHKRDRYRRIVGRVLLEDAACRTMPCASIRDAGLEQIASGHAWHYRQYQSEQTAEERAAYALAEQHAQSTHEGLWRDAQPMPPWEFRRNQRRHGAVQAQRGGSG